MLVFDHLAVSALTLEDGIAAVESALGVALQGDPLVGHGNWRHPRHLMQHMPVMDHEVTDRVVDCLARRLVRRAPDVRVASRPDALQGQRFPVAQPTPGFGQHDGQRE